MAIELRKLEENLARLKLGRMQELIGEGVEDAAHQELSYADFLYRLTEEELRVRFETSAQKRMQQARFPFVRTLEQFDFSFQPALDKTVVIELGSLGFLDQHANIALLGPPGVGKTHLAVSLGVRACAAGRTVRFITAAELLDGLYAALADHSLESKLKHYTRPELLIIDEIGFLPVGQPKAHLLFQLVAKRYGRGSMIVTSNKPFQEWDQLLGDQVIAAAILDRLLENSTILNIKGNSYRLKEKKLALQKEAESKAKSTR